MEVGGRDRLEERRADEMGWKLHQIKAWVNPGESAGFLIWSVGELVRSCFGPSFFGVFFYDLSSFLMGLMEHLYLGLPSESNGALGAWFALSQSMAMQHSLTATGLDPPRRLCGCNHQVPGGDFFHTFIQ